MIPARPLCEAGRRRIAIVAEPVIRHGQPGPLQSGLAAFAAGWCCRRALPADATCVQCHIPGIVMGLSQL